MNNDQLDRADIERLLTAVEHWLVAIVCMSPEVVQRRQALVGIIMKEAAK